jgi:hypothetical protein
MPHFFITARPKKIYELTELSFDAQRQAWLVDGVSKRGFRCWGLFDLVTWCDERGQPVEAPEMKPYRKAVPR